MNGTRGAAIAMVMLAALAGCSQATGPGSMPDNGTMGGGASEGTPETLNQVEASTGNSAEMATGGGSMGNAAGAMGDSTGLTGNSVGMAMGNGTGIPGNTVDASAY
jgi:hypothetical protein